MNEIKFCLVFCVYSTIGIQPRLDDYCKLNMTKTACESRCMTSRTCYTLLDVFEPFSNAQRKYVLASHNKFRDQAASGAFKSNFIENAADMNVLSYDKECEFLAGCFAHQCFKNYSEKMYSVITKKMVGLTMFTSSDKKERKTESDALKKWMGKRKELTSALKFEPNGNDTDGLTQMLWHNSTFVGCAKIVTLKKYPNLNRTTDVICVYRPAGNQEGQEVFTVGEPASKCDNSLEKNKKYKNLCGTIRPFKNDKFIPPLAKFIGSSISLNFNLILIVLSVIIINVLK